MTQTIKVAITGAAGKMGQEAVRMVTSTPHFQLVAAIDRENDGKLLSEIEGMPSVDVKMYNDLHRAFTEQDVDVLIDLTNPLVGRKHMEIAFEHGVRPVVGTTGFNEKDVEELSRIAEEKNLGAIIAPNFAIGAILMMKFSQMAARYLPDVEIIEMHHDKKMDAPSGTAVKTAQMISEVREPKQQGNPEEKEELQGAKGAEFDGMRIHSVRLPGLVAHQEVLFGGIGQTLTIRHDSIDRTSFMPGIRLAVETVMKLDLLVYGLENIIE
ncbi:4-hydroxy-tetrahydrodipicolinate reductase [Anaerobacillus arseniciselenatis]|uniref:4-hydroxy-tetrahydrodipicolinate reductase n=1 Tax=Anaerobacillus arseniciselenatis TaxID=85682 RepID=A0A1S2LVY5_9BACI|nr:4-hydroxy-tetrahydrodipicolinate reductase [Anaerobacillus arseniciselenatis]OIJ15827.1 4-hydroxy-tetrahydrodipicolinate reductase [Anaerobacillus arseniciselenatis]